MTQNNRLVRGSREMAQIDTTGKYDRDAGIFELRPRKDWLAVETHKKWLNFGNRHGHSRRDSYPRHDTCTYTHKASSGGYPRLRTV